MSCNIANQTTLKSFVNGLPLHSPVTQLDRQHPHEDAIYPTTKLSKIEPGGAAKALSDLAIYSNLPVDQEFWLQALKQKLATNYPHSNQTTRG